MKSTWSSLFTYAKERNNLFVNKMLKFLKENPKNVDFRYIFLLSKKIQNKHISEA